MIDIPAIKRRLELADPVVGVGDLIVNEELGELIEQLEDCLELHRLHQESYQHTLASLHTSLVEDKK